MKYNILNTSMLELPLRLLGFIFKKHIGEYYGFNYRQQDAYEHFWWGYIVCATSMAIPILWLKLALVFVAFVAHVIIKEVFLDRKKREGLPPEHHESKAFLADMITRTSGFVFGLPFLII